MARKFLAAFAAVLFLTTSSPQLSYADAASDAAACDALAASLEDTQRPTHVPGVPTGKIDGTAAIAVCTAALISNPDNHRIQFELARALGRNKQTPEIQFSLYMSAAQSGYVTAMINLSNYLANGIGTKADDAEALMWMEKAASGPLKNRVAVYNLADRYYNGKNVDKNADKAGSLYCEAAEMGFPASFVNCGWAYDSGSGREQDGPLAINWYRKSAEAGMPEGQTKLARAYNYGSFVPKNLSLAAEWYQKAVDQNHIEAMAGLGVLYDDGIGVTKDHAKANALYLKAAEAGNGPGQNNLGMNLIEGLGTPQNTEKGVEWLNKAIAGGLDNAAIALANYYDKGIFLTANPKQSAKLYLDVLRHNDSFAIETLVEKAGADLKPATLDAVQTQLKAEGKVFEASAGKLSPAVIAVLKDYPKK